MRSETLLFFLKYWYGKRNVDVYYLFHITSSLQAQAQGVRPFYVTPILLDAITLLENQQKGLVQVFSITKKEAERYQNTIDFHFDRPEDGEGQDMTQIAVASPTLRTSLQLQMILSLLPTPEHELPLPYIFSYDLKRELAATPIGALLSLIRSDIIAPQVQAQFRQLQARKQQIFQRSKAATIDTRTETTVKIFVATDTTNDNTYIFEKIKDAMISPTSYALLTALLSAIPGSENALKNGDRDAIAFLHYTRVILLKHPQRDINVQETTISLLDLFKHLARNNLHLRPIVYVYIIPENRFDQDLSQELIQPGQISSSLRIEDWLELERLATEDREIASGSYGTVYGRFSADEIQGYLTRLAPEMAPLPRDSEYVLKMQSVESDISRKEILRTQANVLDVAKIIKAAPHKIQESFTAHFILPLCFLWNESQTTCIEVQRYGGGKDVHTVLNLGKSFTMANQAMFLQSIIAILQCGFYLIDHGGYYLSDTKNANTVIDDRDSSLSLIDLVFNRLGNPIMSSLAAHTVPLQYVGAYYPQELESYRQTYDSPAISRVMTRVASQHRQSINRYPVDVEKKPLETDQRLIVKFTLVYSLFFILFFLLPDQQQHQQRAMQSYRQKLSVLFKTILQERMNLHWKNLLRRMQAILWSVSTRMSSRSITSIPQQQQKQY